MKKTNHTIKKKKKLTINKELADLCTELAYLSKHLYRLQVKSPFLPENCKRRITRKDIHVLKIRAGLIRHTLKLKKGENW